MNAVLPIALLAVLVSACKPSPDESASASLAAMQMPFAEPGLIEPSVQRKGDAAKGQHALGSAPIVSCGVPLSAYRQLQANADNTNNAVAQAFPGRTGDAAPLPYNVNLIKSEDGADVVASNCLSCHAAPLFGELVVGLGNEFLDFTLNPSVAAERAGTLVSAPEDVRAWQKFADRISVIAPYMQMQTAGVNPANNLTFALMAHRDPVTAEWSNSPLSQLPSTSPPPVSVPPWWRMGKKHAMFNMGEGRGDHARIMMSAAILCADSQAQLQQLDKIAVDIREYIVSLTPPAYPFKIDHVLAGRGENVFNSVCSTCHGTYGDTPSYPNRLVSIEVVGTDPALIDYAFGDGKTWVEWFNRSYFGQIATALPARGYVAPPLDGIWSTAPFLHNGSVPTVRALLDSKSRPVVWRHQQINSKSTQSYDQQNLGWKFRDVSAAKVDSLSDQWLYDTRVPGYANSGHLFGDALDSQQRNAVIEYLKTL